MEAQLNSIISATFLTSLRTRILKINFCKYGICSVYIVKSLSFFCCEAIFIIFPQKLIVTSLPLFFKLKTSLIKMNSKNSSSINKQRESIFPCKLCPKNVTDNDNAILCNLCQTWVHIKCNHLNYTDYKYLQGCNCRLSRRPHHAITFRGCL